MAVDLENLEKDGLLVASRKSPCTSTLNLSFDLMTMGMTVQANCSSRPSSPHSHKPRPKTGRV